MPASSPEREKANRDEILSAAEKLYAKQDFRDISLGDIAGLTSLSRPSIYNYYSTKEEIFLGLLDREYQLWTEEIQKIDPKKANSKGKLATALADTLQSRKLMLKLLTSNLVDLENNSSLESLVAFKKTYYTSVDAIRKCVNACMPEMKGKRLDTFVNLFYPLIFGIYPYTAHSKKQLKAMKEIGAPTDEPAIKDLAKPGIEKLLA